ncbi:hypothetical protein CVT25_009404 [Psilocybe cyanescens]|uniref:Uncharacterized protein n=1 Tax=Psilocybe cyanescens TaxID=93625 RepID=A0A409WW29_PSICY|nr:hypothetical protein CVT25_009404 [Psilocybe cyanescens]
MSRLRCPEISRLPRSTKVASVQWRNQTPGSLDPFFTLQVYKSDLLIDPNHPAAPLKKAVFPSIRRDDLGIKMMPLGLLLREERQFPAIPVLSWRERVEMAQEAGITCNPRLNTPNIRNSKFKPGEQLYPMHDYNNVLLPSHKITPCSPVLGLMLKKTQRRVPMSLHVATSKVRMGQFRHQRKHLETRLRAAINLIVTKGAYFDREAGKIGINMDDGGRKWAMQGWAYMFYPTTQLYHKPYSELIDLLRLLLMNLNRKAIELENKWLNDSLMKEERSRQDQSSTRHNSDNLKHGNKDAPVDRDLLSKMRLVNLQKAHSRQADLAAATAASRGFSLASTFSTAKSTSKHQAKHIDNAQAAESDDRQASEEGTAEDFPSKILAGKSPAVWKEEVVSGLSLLIEPPSPESRTR